MSSDWKTFKSVKLEPRWLLDALSFTGAWILALGLFLVPGCTQEQKQSEHHLNSQIFSRIEVIGTRGVGTGQFNKPRSVAVDRQDNLYVVDMTGRLQKFSPKGRYLAMYQFEQTSKGRPKGMGLDGEGNIIVVEPHYTRVNHMTTNMDLALRWGEQGTNAGMLAFPRSVAVNSGGEMYVSEYMYVERVQHFEKPGGKLIGTFGEPGLGNAQFNRAEGLGIDAENHVYVADSCNHRVQVFTDDGKFLRTYGHAGSGVGELSYPYDLKIDGEGRQYVCEFGNSRVQVFGKDDKPLEILDGRGTEAGPLSTPWSVALDSKGNLYVADAGNHRVVKFVRGGQTTKANGGGIDLASAAWSAEMRFPNPETRGRGRPRSGDLSDWSWSFIGDLKLGIGAFHSERRGW